MDPSPASHGCYGKGSEGFPGALHVRGWELGRLIQGWSRGVPSRAPAALLSPRTSRISRALPAPPQLPREHRASPCCWKILHIWREWEYVSRDEQSPNPPNGRGLTPAVPPPGAVQHPRADGSELVVHPKARTPPEPWHPITPLQHHPPPSARGSHPHQSQHRLEPLQPHRQHPNWMQEPPSKWGRAGARLGGTPVMEHAEPGAAPPKEASCVPIWTGPWSCSPGRSSGYPTTHGEVKPPGTPKPVANEMLPPQHPSHPFFSLPNSPPSCPARGWWCFRGGVSAPSSMGAANPAM